MNESLLVLGWIVVYVTAVFLALLILFRALFSLQESIKAKRWWKK